MMQAADYRGLYAIIPTPAIPGAEDMTVRNTVDTAETERLLNRLIDDGVDGLITLGTTGECATLSETDYRTFAGCVVETVAKRIPVIMGASALGSATVGERLSFLTDLGVEGTLLGLPMWQPASTRTAVGFFTEISRSFPDIAVMVYANKRAFRYEFPDEFWSAISESAPTVTAAKYSRPRDLTSLMKATKGRIHIMPNESTLTQFHEQSPATTTACWATAAGMGPRPAKALMKAVQDRDQSAIARIDAALKWANAPLKPYMGDPEIFALYNIQIEKARINAAGYCNCGPVRPPYSEIPDEIARAAAECGARWHTLCHSPTIDIP